MTFIDSGQHPLHDFLVFDYCLVQKFVGKLDFSEKLLEVVALVGAIRLEKVLESLVEVYFQAVLAQPLILSQEILQCLDDLIEFTLLRVREFI